MKKDVVKKGVLCKNQKQYDKVIKCFKNRGYKICDIKKIGPLGVVVFIENGFIGTDSLYFKGYLLRIKNYYDIISSFFINEIEV